MAQETVSGARYEVIGKFAICNNRTQSRSRMKRLSTAATTARFQIYTAARVAAEPAVRSEHPVEPEPHQSENAGRSFEVVPVH